MRFSRFLNLKTLFAVLIVLSFLRISANLNYNSPFNDEAIYVVVGKMGLFQKDWKTYNAQNWMGGSQYFYPTLTAIAYNFGGITASRLINAVWGILAVISISSITYLLSPTQKRLFASIITFVVAGFSSVFFYISRLATYDMPSFALLFLSLALLLYTKRAKEPAKIYFLGFTTLILSFLFKYTTLIFIPFIILLSFWQSRKGKEIIKIYLVYFLYPLIFFAIFYLATQIEPTLVYFKSQSVRENITQIKIFDEFLNNSRYIWPIVFIGSLGMLLNKISRIKLLILLFFTSQPLTFHLFTHRLATLDKHTFLSVAFAAVIAGVGISELIYEYKKSFLYKIALIALLILLSFYAFSTLSISHKYNLMWDNADLLMNFLADYQKPGDKILAEAGPQAILSSYAINHPSNITTFDWLKYKGQENTDAYAKAVKDGYFDLIQLEANDRPKNPLYTSVNKKIIENLDKKYRLIFKQGRFYVFKKSS